MIFLYNDVHWTDSLLCQNAGKERLPEDDFRLNCMILMQKSEVVGSNCKFSFSFFKDKHPDT